MSRTSNVSSLSSIDDCFYYNGSLVAMFCPSIVAILIALVLSLRVLTLEKQKKETDKDDGTLCGSPCGNAFVLALIGLVYPIFLLGFSIYLGCRKITGKGNNIGGEVHYFVLKMFQFSKKSWGSMVLRKTFNK